MSNDKKTLHLVLKKKWWDMIESGVKTEEYREIKPYWLKRLVWDDRCNEPVSQKDIDWICSSDTIGLENLFHKWVGFSPVTYTHVCFHKGYTANTMTFEIESISVGKGNPEWGAPKEEVFIIKLGKLVALEVAQTMSKDEIQIGISQLVDSSELVINISK